MGAINFRGAYEFDPEAYDLEGGGLLGIRRRMLQQQSQQQGTDFGSTPNGAPGYDPGSYDSPEGDLLGRLLALQAEQGRQQPFAGNDGQPPSAPRDPNFRQLSRRTYAVGSGGAIAASNRSDDQPSPSYPPVADGTSLDSPSASPQGGGLFGGYGDKPVPASIAGTPRMTAVPVGWRGGGVPFPRPIPPMGPGTLPQFPVPQIPDWLKAGWQILQMYPKIISGMGGGGGDDCEEERRQAHEICTDAWANGWKSDYGVGPYRTPHGGPWTIDDCKRGLISERCGGSAVDFGRNTNDKGRRR